MGSASASSTAPDQRAGDEILPRADLSYKPFLPRSLSGRAKDFRAKQLGAWWQGKHEKIWPETFNLEVAEHLPSQSASEPRGL